MSDIPEQQPPTSDDSEIALLEALQEIARWSGNARVKWYVDQYAIKLMAAAKEPT